VCLSVGLDIETCNLASSDMQTNRGVAMGWTGVEMSTLLLPKVVPEIDANLVSF